MQVCCGRCRGKSRVACDGCSYSTACPECTTKPFSCPDCESRCNYDELEEVLIPGHHKGTARMYCSEVLSMCEDTSCCAATAGCECTSKYISYIQHRFEEAGAEEERRVECLVNARLDRLRVPSACSVDVASVLQAVLDMHDAHERDHGDDSCRLGFRTLLSSFVTVLTKKSS